MLKYFPFADSFDPRMGGRALDAGDPLCVIDLENYESQVRRKRAMLDALHDDYFRGGPQTLTAQWEVLALLLADLAACYPAHFQLEKTGSTWQWFNRILNEQQVLRLEDGSSLPCEPLDWVGRQVQDDLVLVGADSDHRLIGGLLCFANAWSIATHLDKTFLEIHKPTPQATMPAVQVGFRLLDQLKPGRTIWRLNWNFKFSDELDLSTPRQPQYEERAAALIPTLTPSSIGQHVFLRVERQTLTRLPRSQAILFGIHTYISRLDAEAAQPQRARSILAVLRSAPQDVKEYKALLPIEELLVAYLEAKAA